MKLTNEELAGRIDGVARFAMYVATKLHRDGICDVTDLIAVTRSSSETRKCPSVAQTVGSRAVLAQMAHELEAALQSTGYLPQSPIDPAEG